MTVSRHAVPAGARLHPLRAFDLSASDIGAAAGVDPYKSPLALWAEKSGLLSSSADNALTARGRWFECAAIAALRERHPDWDIRYPLGLYFRDPPLGASPDALAITDQPGITNLQIKVVAKPEFERKWQDGPPQSYLYQVITEGLLTDADQSLLVALVVDAYSAELHYFPIPRHAALERRVREIAVAFWDRVARGERPPADVTRDAETVAAIYPQSVPEPVLDLTGDNRLAELLPARAMLKAEIASLEKDVARIDDELKIKLGPAELATLPGWKISWKTQTRAEHVVAASTFRKLLVSEAKEKEEAA